MEGKDYVQQPVLTLENQNIIVLVARGPRYVRGVISQS